MPEIAVLDPRTIDKIAAGEVVERPVSVVKELVENAMDAGANAITVEIQEGGVSFIRVTDNGNGIPAAQVRTAFLRHATSKIRNVEDLLHVTSLGFRGEALSSIAAVAKVELVTKTPEELTGVRYELEGGKETSFSQVGAPDGTTIMVRNLFYNIPVRRKFLKSYATEGSYIADLMEHLALSRPEISFKFVMNKDVRFHTSGNGNLKEVIYRIYGRDVSESLLPVTCEDHGIRITGYIGKPEMNRANRNFEIYFVNHRYIRSAVVSRAVEEAYKPFLMQHKYPFCVLSIEISADEIDVNVHPSKMEIRFIRQMEFYDMMCRSISQALSGKELIPDVILDEKKRRQESEAEQKELVKDAPEPFEKSRILQTPGPKVETEFFVAETTPVYQAASNNNMEHASAAVKTIADVTKEAEEDSFFTSTGEKPVNPVGVSVSAPRIFGMPASQQEGQAPDLRGNIIKQKDQIIVENPIQMELFPDKLLTQEALKEHRILGQIFDTYWLVAFKDKLFIIDQHAAHEKVKYERLMKHLQEKEIPSQMLNPPIILTLNAKNRGVLEEYRDCFAGLGFEIEEFGGNEFAIRAVPMDLYGCDEKQLFEEVLDELADGPVKGTPEVINSKIASMACKSAVKGNTALSLQEAKELIDELLTLENPYHCPHGRPTIISMSKYEIEKKFKRIVT